MEVGSGEAKGWNYHPMAIEMLINGAAAITELSHVNAKGHLKCDRSPFTVVCVQFDPTDSGLDKHLSFKKKKKDSTVVYRV